MKKNKKKAFSLIEIVIVMAIIAVLSTLAVPSIKKYMYKANKTKVISAVSEFNTIYIEYLFEDSEIDIPKIISKEGIENLKKDLKLDELDSNGHFKLSNIDGDFFIEDNTIKAKIKDNEVIGR